jgi:hypothetical protein
MVACAPQQPYGYPDVRVVRLQPGAAYSMATVRPAAPYRFHAPRPPHVMVTPPMLAPLPPMPPLPPLPPHARGDIEATIAAAKAKGHQVIDRNENGRRTVIITGPGTNLHYEYDDTPEGRARAEAAREAGRAAREAGRAAREAGRLAREEGRRAREAGAAARLQGLQAHARAMEQHGNVMVLRREEIDRLTRDARAQGEAARRQAEAMRPQIDEIRRNAQRLREQCERGEIKCEIIITEPGRP